MTGAHDELETYHKDHWAEIEPERLARYEAMFRLDDARADRSLAPVGAQPGEVVLDFGCGPGYVASQLARLVGPSGHVHALDLNAEFVARARAVAAEAGRADRVTVHHATDERIPLPDASVDRAYAKNVLEYVPDVHAVLTELRRVLRPGGTLVASDSDFGFVVVEPLAPAEVEELFAAAAPAFRDRFIGRHLRAAFGRAGFTDVAVTLAPVVDTEGAMRGIVENMLGYARRFDRMTEARAAELRAAVDRGLADGTYLASLPQWWVSGRVPG